jgi:hypothetical protein
MGFVLFISCTFNICTETGRPYYLDSVDGNVRKVYGIPDITVPKEFRPFLQQFGQLFHAYTTARISDEYSHITEMSTLAFLDQYPRWSDVLMNPHYDRDDDVWTEKDHDQFKKALEWFSKQSVGYTVSWSY